MTHHVIIGAGPVGWTLAGSLAAAGQDVRIITRDGRGPDHPRVERVQADAADTDSLRRATADAQVLYNAASPPYRRWVSDWPALGASVLAAAQSSGAVLVSVANLYGYGPVDHPMVETDPLDATSAKGRVRAGIWRDLLAAHQAGRVRATELRSSDYFGPRVLMSQLGERVVAKVVTGETVRVIGAVDAPHSWTFIDDVVRGLITIGSDERAWGRAWHTPTAPPRSQRQIITALGKAAGTAPVRIRTIPPLVLKALGAFVPDIRELSEIRYQFDEPFVVDSSAMRSTFGLEPTPPKEAFTETVSWYLDRSSTAEGSDATDHHLSH